MFDLHLPRKRRKVVAVADVGSGSVGVAILSLQPDAPAKILASERFVLPLEDRKKDATLTALGDNLVQVGQKVMKRYTRDRKNPEPPELLYCVIHAPWTHSATVQAVTKFDKQTKVTRDTIGDLAKKALGQEVQVDKKHILEASVVRVELNGYPTGSPVGKPAHEIVVSALISDCDPDLRTKVETSLETLFPHMKPVFRSSTRALVSTLRELPGTNHNYLVVDMVSEGTNLIAIREGVVAEQTVVPEGVHSIIKRVAPKGMPEETLTLIRMLGRDQCSTAACEAIQEALSKAEPELVRIFGAGMTACASVRRLPEKLILIVQPDMMPWLTKFFSRIDFTQFTQTTQPFSVEPLAAEDLTPWVELEHGATLDTGIALSIALVNREQGEA